MVADDLGGSSQSEDPLPRRTNDSPGSADRRVAELRPPTALAGPLCPVSNEPALSAAGDGSAGRVPLWNRLPRSIWLMSTLALTIAA